VASAGVLGRKSLVLLLATWTGTGANLLASILIARSLGPEAMGALSVSFGLSGLVMAALVPGFAQAHLKHVAQSEDPGRCLGTYVAIKLTLCLPILVVAPFVATSVTTVFALVFVGRILSSLAEAFTLTLIARERAVEQTIVLLAARGARLATTVAVLLATSSFTLVAATFALEGAVELAMAATLTRMRAGIRWRGPTWESVASYWRYARPLLVTAPIGMAQDSLDRVAVAHWAGLTAAGYYHVARGCWELLGSISAYPAMFLFTRLSSLFAERTAEGDHEARAFFHGALDRLLFAVVPLGLVLWVVAKPGITFLYGSALASAAEPVKVLVVATFAAALFNPYTQVLYALDVHARFVPIVIVRAALYLVLLAALVPALGATGAAFCRVFLLVVPAWIYVRWTRRLAGIGFHWPSVVYLGLFALSVGVYEGLTFLGASWAVSAIGASGVYAVGMIAYPRSRDAVDYYRGLVMSSANTSSIL
jgi:O-antigen/teichoic acid export membrane protein